MQSMLVFSILLGVILSQSKLDKILLIANYFSIVLILFFYLLQNYWFCNYNRTANIFYSKSWKRHTKMVDTDCP